MPRSNSSAPKNQEYSIQPFFDTSPLLLCIAGYDGYFKKINPAVSQLLGYSEEELIARPIREFIHPEDRALTALHRKELILGKQLTNFENRYVTASGQTVWLSWNSSPVNDSSIVYAIAQNITHIKSREASINRTLTGLSEEKNNLISLNYRTAHDIRSPVGGLLTIIELIDASKIEEPKTAELFQWLQTSAQELHQHLNNSLEGLNQAHSGRLPLESINLNENLRTVTHQIQFIMQDTNTELEVDFEAFDEIVFHRAYLESIFQNLLTNSIKYRSPQRAPRISIKSRLVAGEKTIEFSDNGMGFDAEQHREHIFQKHQTFHTSKDSHGIGLYLIHHQLTSLGGQITVESQPDAGACFTLRFKEL
jgi:PAS domain S-box-containing protein